jgi:hypothetical protein
VIAPNVRSRWNGSGLAEMRYSALDEELESADFARIVDEFGFHPRSARLAIKRLLDLFRMRRAVAHEALRRRLSARDEVAQAYEIVPGREVGIPVAFLEPGTPALNSRVAMGCRTTETFAAWDDQQPWPFLHKSATASAFFGAAWRVSPAWAAARACYVPPVRRDLVAAGGPLLRANRGYYRPHPHAGDATWRLPGAIFSAELHITPR